MEKVTFTKVMPKVRESKFSKYPLLIHYYYYFNLNKNYVKLNIHFCTVKELYFSKVFSRNIYNMRPTFSFIMNKLDNSC